ncbi:cell division protein FtsA [Patescibacteria group bacterium]|nr:cell division protein FtsA [Patescibacteria group bacterium]MBU1966910.1 cell division protein FtsA [Patescibacteria group bacterium]MBU2543499.1 cell division protein FtsA [Patescibacteria group bacterium]
MPRSRVITAIDLGTDKCATLIATLDEETNQLQVKGVATVPSHGIRKSQIVDLEKAVITMTESLDAAERMAGFDVKSAYVSVSGTHIKSQNSKGVVAVAAPNQEITSQDVDRVIEAARAISLPADRSVIHVIPRDFKVDSQEGIKDPVGMTGVRLESEAHIVTGMTTALKNLEKCVHDLGLNVDGFVFSGLSASEVVVSETERELGVVVVDIGAGSTSLCVFVEGTLELSDSLPIGARHITQDIALGCRVSLEAAEKIKLALTDSDPKEMKPNPGETKEEFTKRKKLADVIDPVELDVHDSMENLSKKKIIEGIMVPRMKEILTMVGKKLEQKNLIPVVPAGIIISGGGAETVGIEEVAKRTLNLPARIGMPKEIKGLTMDIHNPSFVNSIGLLEYGRQHGAGSSTGSGLHLGSLFKTLFGKKFGGTIGSFFKSLMP